MAVAPVLLDNKAKERRNAFEGQLSLFDIAGEEEKKEFQVTFPDVGEYAKAELLAFEKEILGVYISGHPLDDYEPLWRKNITAAASDFIVDEDTEEAVVRDGVKAVIGGLVTGKTVKTTRTGHLMAFITLEDLMGSVEVIVFPRDYEANRDLLTEDAKLFIRGRVSLGDEPVVIYLKKERAKKLLPPNWNVEAHLELLRALYCKVGEKNVKVVEKSLDKSWKMH